LNREEVQICEQLTSEETCVEDNTVGDEDECFFVSGEKKCFTKKDTCGEYEYAIGCDNAANGMNNIFN
jgi:hypothetical protein